MGDKNKDIGKSAERPRQIPAKGWKQVLLRVKDQFTDDYLDVVSAGVGFYFFLSIFPLMAAAISIYGLVFDPAEVQQHIDQLTQVLPEQAHGVIADGLQNLAQQEQGLGLALVLSILISLWTANQGTKALFDGVNIAYDEKITRGFIKNNLLGLAITIGGIVVGAICVALVIGFPALVGNLGMPETVATVISWVRWPVLFLIVIFSIGVVYKFAPDRENPKFRWVSWGAGFATVLWIIGSVLFSLYVDNFGDYDATYGAVAAIIILMLWLQLTAISILIGAEINSELEHQTAKDTTVGEPMPMGAREAYHADHVAEEDEKKEEAEREKQKMKQKHRDSIRKEREREIRARKHEKKDRRDQNGSDT